jgi:hypothetical protein
MGERWDGRLSGPLAGYWVGFGEHLVELGYAPVSVTAQRALFRDVSVWLDSRSLGVERCVPARWTTSWSRVAAVAARCARGALCAR